MGVLYGGCCRSLQAKDWGGRSIYQTFIKREKLGGRTEDEVSGAFRLSGIVLLSFVLYAQASDQLGLSGMRVGICKAQSALLEKSVP